MLTQIAPALAPSTAADLRAQLVQSHDAATVDAVLASVAAWLDATITGEQGKRVLEEYGPVYAGPWGASRRNAARQLTAAVPAVPAVRIPQQRTAA